ncbi:NAD(P)-dependent oxidoreductase [Alkalihalophilus lindianensis]|uniref:precorrin-2 dehydrogenase n=1 Tax=Alkalihalophilus lindianensis TaxID=1630542 RepID=A0ABU3X5W0_9BACI|nr:NAD(P)-dependent oxidoreductase [Alkalihalophilus lindianensis]MDV2683275.1 NAD(P)-dependent oxidoreductase [Alkalihalophilus lindianensis]
MTSHMMLKLKERSMVFIGGGQVATRHLVRCHQEGAKITVIAPTITDTIAYYVKEEKVSFERRVVSPNESFMCDILMLTTDDPILNDCLYRSRIERQWVYLASDGEKSDIQFPLSKVKGDLSIALSTNGASPTYAKHLMKQFLERLPHNVEKKVDFLKRARQQVKESTLLPSEKRQLLIQIANDEWLKQGDCDDRFLLLLQQIQQSK